MSDGFEHDHDATENLQAPADIRRVALLQLLITLCSSVGSGSGRLTAAQTVALIRRSAPPHGQPMDRAHHRRP
ncbi:hypothetical protein GCM10010193_37440 [Kitasatospora atroaurantiaca]|uniref:Uncharacterized protein n=1 Tax=Kitasatospora atroaurantiaca TaxID=285545 RepID=A0A561F207_9ACTN|nr:hypothetical protein [Kitasatospora atroaurantiaca]TWE21889.1 hypothetical protein FB465_7133 [Kitasatospora atroaurantiaca]